MIPGSRAWLTSVAVAILLVVCPRLVLAQAEWYRPYKKGVDAFTNKKWDEAIKQFNEAVKADAKPARNKQLDGSLTDNYFPYVHLALAYLNVNDLANADVNFKKSDAQEKDLVTQLVAQRTQGEKDLALRLNAAAPAKPAAPPPATPPPSASPAPAPGGTTGTKPAGPTPFETELATMDRLRNGSRWEEALTSLAQLERLDPAEYARRGLSDVKTTVARSRATELVTEGNALLAKQSLTQADAKFVAAEQLSPGVPGAALGRSLVTEAAKVGSAPAPGPGPPAGSAPVPTPPPAPVIDNATRSRQAVAEGRRLAASGKFAEADAQYQAAIAADPNNSEALSAFTTSKGYAVASVNGRALLAQRKFAEARVQLLTAQALDAPRFTSDRLENALKQIDDTLGAAKPADVAALTIRNAVMAYLQGDAPRAINLLQGVKTDQIDNRTRADLDASLGVAFASRALTASTPDERAKSRDQALAAFRRALGADPTLQLSTRLVSPRILSLFEASRGK